MITAQQAADQAAELKQIRQELAYIARALSPWIEMAMIYFNPSADDLANKL